jgi:cytochrome b6
MARDGAGAGAGPPRARSPATASRSRGSVARFLDDRLGVGSLVEFVRKKDVPHHRHSLWTFFGGMTLFLFAIQVATGILLLFYYEASESEAFGSVQFLTGRVRFGWLVRSMHAWSANLMIASLFLHMFSAYLLQAYRPPRELTWVSGVLLFLLVLGFGFSGYLLPWNQLAFFATKVGTDIAGAVPFVGASIVEFLRGGEDVTGITLSRFFALHVAILPLASAAVLGLHLLLVQRHGISVPVSVERGGAPVRRIPFVPDFVLRELIGWYVALAALAALAALDPWPLGIEADPLAPAPEGIKPEWFFLWLYQTLRVLPPTIVGIDGETVGVVAIGLAFLAWTLVPFLDRKGIRGEPSRGFAIAGVLVLAYILGMTAWGYWA